MIYLKSERELAEMRTAGKVTALILAELEKCLLEGTVLTGLEINERAEKLCSDYGVKPAFKGYHGFPASVCVSPNSVVVHGIPHARKFSSGDLVSIDFGVVSNGFYGDSAVTVSIGNPGEDALRLLRVTKESLWLGIQECVPGRHVSDISHAVQKHVEKHGFSVVREFVGHGIGRQLHEEPQIPNFGVPGRGPILKEGMVVAIEPMVNFGKHSVKIADDGWTASTEDGSLSAHFEHTVAITKNGPEVLTMLG